jgi:hypothetical protein
MDMSNHPRTTRTTPTKRRRPKWILEPRLSLNSFSFNFPTPALLKIDLFVFRLQNLAPASEVAGGHAIPF